MNSWQRMDSGYDSEGRFFLGPNDLDLAKRLRKAGSDHRKFMRQILVSVDITAPLYWWKEYETYQLPPIRQFLDPAAELMPFFQLMIFSGIIDIHQCLIIQRAV